MYLIWFDPSCLCVYLYIFRFSRWLHWQLNNICNLIRYLIIKGNGRTQVSFSDSSSFGVSCTENLTVLQLRLVLLLSLSGFLPIISWIEHLVDNMSNISEKCPLKFPRTQVISFKLLVLPKTTLKNPNIFSLPALKTKKTNFHIWEARSGKCLAFDHSQCQPFSQREGSMWFPYINLSTMSLLPPAGGTVN